eukprot:5382068-Amphidinium_carterae.2
MDKHHWTPPLWASASHSSRQLHSGPHLPLLDGAKIGCRLTRTNRVDLTTITVMPVMHYTGHGGRGTWLTCCSISTCSCQVTLRIFTPLRL